MELRDRNKIFISNFKHLSKEDIHKYFEKFGGIMHISAVIDIKAGQRKEYGFIQFGNTDSVNRALCQ